MKRETAMFIIKPGYKSEIIAGVDWYEGELNRRCAALGAKNVSCWSVESYLYIYGEFEDDNPKGLEDLIAPYRGEISLRAEQVGTNSDMRLMYHCIGKVRQDKSLIRRRVFATILKEGCADEYFARHQALIDARNDIDPDGAETNFTIRCARGKYIFGYCELVKSFDHEMTEEEKASTTAWETRQLEIMDWLTDDVDRITGQKHKAMEKLFVQKGY